MLPLVQPANATSLQKQVRTALGLDYPHTPLHNNLTENQILAQVIRRKVLAGTCRLGGCQARDMELELKICHKLKVRFWH